MPGKNLNDVIENFQSKYGVVVNFEEMQRSANSLMALETGFLRKNVENPEGRRYNGGFIHLLNQCIENKTSIGADKDYDLSKLDVVQFLREYEEIMALRHNAGENKDTVRRDHDGVAASELYENAKRAMQKYNKPLSEIWAERVLGGKMSFYDIKAIVAGKEDDITTLYPDPKKLTNAVLAQRAMKIVCDSRGFLWMITHLIDYFRERNYLNDLTHNLKNYEAMSLEVGPIVEKDSVSALDSTMKKLDTHINQKSNLTKTRVKVETELLNGKESKKEQIIEEKEYRKELNALDESVDDSIDYNDNNDRSIDSESDDEYENEYENMKSDVVYDTDDVQNENDEETDYDVFDDLGIDNIVKMTNDDNKVEGFISEIFNKVPPFEKKGAKDYLVIPIKYSLSNSMKKMNEQFADAASEGVEATKQMEDVIKRVFEWSGTVVEALEYRSETDKLVAQQVVTDMVMKKLDIVNDYPKEFGQFANGYLLNNPDHFVNKRSFDADQQLESYENARKAYNDFTRESVSVNLDSKDMDKKLSERVNDLDKVKNLEIKKV